mgnify:CR=1 FL=1
METTKISDTELTPTRIGLGTWAIGGAMWGGTDEEISIQTIHKALDHGITLIDTAPVYGYGTSEEFIGKALQQYDDKTRSEIYLATKVGLNWDDGLFRDSRRDRIMQEIEDSLERLQTDYIDLYQIHWPDPHVPIKEAAETLNELYEEGVIKSIGVSNYSPEQMDEFQQHAPLHSVQPPYNLFERDIEKNLIPYASENNITTLLYSSICRGLLTGKMTPDYTFPEDDIRNSDPKFQQPRFSQYLDAVEQLDHFTREKYDKRVIHLALRWVLDQPGADIALWGARNPGQLDPIEEVTGWSLDEKDFDQIDLILNQTIKDPVGPEFMAPPSREDK